MDGIEPRQVAENTFRVLVDYGKNTEEMIEVGKYDWVSPDISSKISLVRRCGEHEVEVHLVRFDRIMTSKKDIIQGLDEMGLYPAGFSELLALGAQQPRLQREFSIAALGSVWWLNDGIGMVACLCSRGSERKLDIMLISISWNMRWRFAAVRK